MLLPADDLHGRIVRHARSRSSSLFSEQEQWCGWWICSFIHDEDEDDDVIRRVTTVVRRIPRWFPRVDNESRRHRVDPPLWRKRGPQPHPQ